MQPPVQITVREMAHSEALDARIHVKAAKLAEFHPNITSCRVTVEEAGKHQRQGRQFAVNLDVRVPGKEFVVSKSHEGDVYVALRDAFEAMRRQIDEFMRAKHNFVKTHAAGVKQGPEQD